MTPKPQANGLDEILDSHTMKLVPMSQRELFWSELEPKIQALITEKMVKLANLYGEPRCENLHHNKKNQHTYTEDCPVEKAINAQLKENNDE